MIEGDFRRSKAPIAVRLSGGDFDFVVETLDNACGDYPSGSKPVQDQWPMSAQRLGDFLHRFDLRAHGAGAPAIEESSSPVGGDVAPEELEVLLEQVASHRLEVVAQQVGELDLLGFAEVLGAFEQAPATALEHRFEPLALEFSGFGSTDLVDGLVHVCGDVEAVEDMACLRSFLGHDFQVGFPHIAAYVLQRRAALLAELTEEPQQGLDRASLADPQEALASAVNLVDQSQIVLASVPVDLIDSDRFDAVEVAVGQAPLDDRLHGAKDGLPARVKALGDIGPGQQPGPIRQEESMGSGQWRFAFSPGDALDADAASATVHASHGIDEEDWDSPQRHKTEASLFENIVTGTSMRTARADRLVPGMRPNMNFEPQSIVPTAEHDIAVDETWELVDAVEYSLDQHSALSCGGEVWYPHPGRIGGRMHSPISWSLRGSFENRRSWWLERGACGPGVEAVVLPMVSP